MAKLAVQLLCLKKQSMDGPTTDDRDALKARKTTAEERDLQVSGRESKEREKEDSHRLVGYFLSFHFLDEEPEELNDGYAAAVMSMMLVVMMDESGQLILGRGAGSRSRGGGDAGS
ncbi:hypothetical protein AK812_SmicGene3680 [Symbiodinium microadriaticum]|uniref:Uncharacterized protein n=1 Tax=Symbiodinium microadriaticum TaxID=2951 RepID=A0A1Q9EYD9_SYMMI|nr:hypothetical protein AK812_SmicGene3680 [Symbiodinium microadriaticum]